MVCPDPRYFVLKTSFGRLVIDSLRTGRDEADALLTQHEVERSNSWGTHKVLQWYCQACRNGKCVHVQAVAAA